jgi:hypothetical protein
MSQSIEKDQNNNNNDNINNNEAKMNDVFRRLNYQENNNIENSSHKKINEFLGTFGVSNQNQNITSNNNSNVDNNNEANSNQFITNSINSTFTFGKNPKNVLNDSQKKKSFGVDSIIKNIDMGALNYYSKYENDNNNEESNNNSSRNINIINNSLRQSNNEDNQMEHSMQSISKLVAPSAKNNLLSTWKKKSINGNASIQEDIENENEKEFENNNNNTNINCSNIFNNTNKNSQIKESITNPKLLLTFGEEGNMISGEKIRIKNNVFDKNKTKKFEQTKKYEEEYEEEDEEQEEKADEDDNNYDNYNDSKIGFNNKNNNTYNFDSNNKNNNTYNFDSNNNSKNNYSKKENQFLDFDNFCDIPNSNNSTLKFTNTKKNNEHLESEGICNVYADTKNKDMTNLEITQKVNDALKDAKDSSDEEEVNKIANQMNFFGDTLGKDLKPNKYKVKNNQNVSNKKDENINMIISGEVFDMDVFKSGQSNRHLNLFGDSKKPSDKNINMNRNRNITEESEDLKDSYCDTLLKNIEQYRNANNNTNSFTMTNKE